MTYAPIVVFGFNRPGALKNTISSLLNNEEAKFSDLFVLWMDHERKRLERWRK